MQFKALFLAATAAALIAAPLPASAATAPYGGVDHTRKIKSYGGPSTCLACHSTSKMGSNLAEDVFNSAHFQLRTLTGKIDMPGGGSHGMIDRACGLPGTTAMAGNYAYQISSPLDGSQRDDGCGRCHVAYKLPIMYASAAEATPDIDCLRCHAAYYGEEWDDPAVIATYGANAQPHARAVTLLGGMPTWSQDRSLKTAQSVGNLPQSKFCNRCHEHNYTGYKRATPMTPETDVHAAAGLDCRQCHVMERHRIARGGFVTDGVANDLPDREVTCAAETCHGTVPHVAGPNADQLNKHIANLACEACHIPSMDVADNVATRAWAPFTFNPLTNAWDATPATTDGFLYPGFFDAAMTFHDSGTPPQVRWFDGGASMLAQPYGSYDGRKSNGGCAKLYALKPFTNGMLFDAGWLPGPPQDGSFDLVNGTWAFSMKAFYEGNWNGFLQAGFLDAAYPTPASYWAARPDMARMLNMFPMMLNFDRKTYLERSGIVVGTPLPGPQSAATYPGIVEAINRGMGMMAIGMGYAPPTSDPVQVGSNFWSQSFFGMWVPMNMDPTSPFLYEIGSFITVSHSIRGAASPVLADANYCFTCHRTDAECAPGAPLGNAKRVDFALLGYPDLNGDSVTDPKCGDYQAPQVKPAATDIAMSITTSRKAQTLTVAVTVVDASNGAPLPGVTVNGTLGGPAADTGLPKTFTGITGNDGKVSFTYKKTALAPGVYTFCVTSLVYNGNSTAASCCNSITK